MLAELHNNFRQPLSAECSRLLIRNHNGDVIAAAVETADRTIWLGTVKDDNFSKALKLMGIEQTLTVQDIQIANENNSGVAANSVIPV